MAKALKKGEQVYVPLNRLRLQNRVTGSAFLPTEILADAEPEKRSVFVDLRDGGATASVPTSAVHRNVGVCIYAIGDVSSELLLIDPLRKSVLQYCRLLVPADSLRARTVRSIAELKECWVNHDHAKCTHVVLIGHGGENGLKFAVDGTVSGTDIGKVFDIPNSIASTFISLCCKTGYASFAKPFTKSAKCNVFIAPYHTVHGAIACQFLTAYLGHHFLDGRTVKVAYNNAQTDIPSGVKFRLWENGKLRK
jgi:hypothetical protein